MVNKFLETANKIGDEIHARVPTDHQGSAFHCPGFIKLLKDYRKFSNKSKKIEDIYQKM